MNKKFLLVSAAMLSVCLAACQNPPKDSESKETSAPAETSVAASSEESQADLTNKDLPLGVTTFTAADGTTKNLNRSSIYKAAGDPHVNSAPEGGKKQKLLVNPLRFQKDESDSRDTIVADDALLTKITKAFTATDEELEPLADAKIYSVKSFYEQSSFGKGAFDVVVLPCWVDYNGTASQFKTASGGNGGVYASSYLKTWYNGEYAKANHGALGADWQYTWKDFDSDEDGFIDLVWNVYAYPYTENSTEFWWAYVTYTNDGPNVASPNVKTLAFASTNFMSKFNGYDTHTLIHETGHTYGVLDYYDYNNYWKPMGGVDYMDQNLGDHCAFTKFHYGWVNPWVIKEDMLKDGKVAEITLRTTTLTGDCLVLASPNYNMTAFDEFMMVELMGPHGLAERDYTSGYENTKGYTTDGIRITHVDNRMWRGNHDEWISDPNDLGKNGGDVRNSNSHGGRNNMRADMDFWPNEDGSPKQYFCQLSLMDSSNVDSAMNWTNTANFTANNGTLFTKGQRFNLSSKTAWAKTFMPSGTNLWNKAKTTTGWQGNNQKFTIDENCTFNYFLKVKNIVKDPECGAIATLEIRLDN